MRDAGAKNAPVLWASPEHETGVTPNRDAAIGGLESGLGLTGGGSHKFEGLFP